MSLSLDITEGLDQTSYSIGWKMKSLWPQVSNPALGLVSLEVKSYILYNSHLHLIIWPLVSSFQAKWNLVPFLIHICRRAKLYEYELVPQSRKAKDYMDLKNPKMEKRVVIYVTLRDWNPEKFNYLSKVLWLLLSLLHVVSLCMI